MAKKGNKPWNDSDKYRIILTCIVCGKKIRIRKSLSDKRKTCSRICANTRISQRMKGNIYLLGKTRSEESRNKMRLAWNKMRPRMSGKNAPNWRGGKTSLTLRVRNSNKYTVWRKSVFERDSYTCQICKQYGGRLQADHIIPLSVLIEGQTYLEVMSNPKVWNLTNGRTLCRLCHFKTDTYAQRAVGYKKKLLNQYN